MSREDRLKELMERLPLLTRVKWEEDGHQLGKVVGYVILEEYEEVMIDPDNDPDQLHGMCAQYVQRADDQPAPVPDGGGDAR